MAKKDTPHLDEWVKTFKSVAKYTGRIGADVLQSVAPNISQSVVSASEMARDTRDVLQKTKTQITNTKKMLDTTVAGRNAMDVVRGAYSDIQSGSFSLDRLSDAAYNAADEFDFNTENVEDASSTNNTAILGRVVAQGNAASIEGMKQMTTTLSNVQIRTSKASTARIENVILTGNAQLTTHLMNVERKLDTTNAHMAAIVKYQNTVQSQAYQATLNYYASTTQLLNKIGEAASAIWDIQKQMLDEREQMRQMTNRRRTPSGGFDVSGGFNYSSYKDFVKNNFENSLIGTMLGMGKTVAGMGMSMGGMMGNPVEMIMGQVISEMLPKNLKKSIGRLDKTFTHSLDNVLYRIGDLADSPDFFKSTIGSLFGKRRGTFTSARMGNFKKDAMSWNGVAQKTLVEVIPSYLARIESALTGKSARFYNMSTGKFMNEKQIRNSFQTKYQDTVEFGMGEFTKKFNKSFDASLDKDQLNNIQSKLNEFVYTQLMSTMPTNSKETNNELRKMLSDAGVSGNDLRNLMMEFSDTIKSTRENLNSLTRSIEDELDSAVYRNLFNTTGKKTDDLYKRGDIFAGTEFLKSGVRKEFASTSAKMRDEREKQAEAAKKGMTSKIQQWFDKTFKRGSTRTNVSENDSTVDFIDGIANIMYDISMGDVSNFRTKKSKPLKSRTNYSGKNIAPDQDTPYALALANQEEEDPTESAIIETAEATKETAKDVNSLNKGLFGKDGFISNFWKNKKLQKGFEWMKDKLFNEKTGVFAPVVSLFKDGMDYVKYVFTGKGYTNRKNKSYPDNDNNVIAYFKNGYDFVFRNTMGYIFGKDFRENETFRKYFNWMDWKGRSSDTSSTGIKEKQPPKSNSNLIGIEDKSHRMLPAIIGDNGDAYVKAKIDELNRQRRAELRKIHPDANVNNEAEYTKKSAEINSRIDAQIRALQNAESTATALFGESSDEPMSIEDKQKKAQESFTSNIKKHLPKDIAATIAGAGVGASLGIHGTGLLGSLFLPGGPIGGALLGLGISIASRSEKIRDFIFGKENADGVKTGGLISDKMQKFMKDNMPLIVGAGALGALKSVIFGGSSGGLGLIVDTLLPGGPIGGAIVGTGLALLKNNEKVQDVLFGKKDADGKRASGMFSKAYGGTRKIFEKSSNFIKGGLKGLGIGALSGAVIGKAGIIGAALTPGGPVGMGLVGLGLGIASQSEKFQDLLFGTKEFDKNRNLKGRAKDGLLYRVRNMLVLNVFEPIKDRLQEKVEDFAYWTKDAIVYPFRLAFGPIADSLKGIKANIENIVEDAFNNVADTVGKVLSKAVKNVFSPFTKLFGKIGNALLDTVAFGARASLIPISAPLKLLEFATMGKRRKEYVHQNRLLFENIGSVFSDARDIWANSDDPKYRGIRGIFNKFGDIREGIDTARISYDEAMAAQGFNTFNWRGVRREKRDDRLSKQILKNERGAWAKVNDLRKEINTETHGADVYYTDEEFEKVRNRFAKLGINKDFISTQADLNLLLHDREAWKDKFLTGEDGEAGLISKKGIKIQETRDQERARMNTQKFQDGMTARFDTAIKLFAKLAMRDAMKRKNEVSLKDISDITSELKGYNLSWKDIGIDPGDIIDVNDIPDADYDEYLANIGIGSKSGTKKKYKGFNDFINKKYINPETGTTSENEAVINQENDTASVNKKRRGGRFKTRLDLFSEMLRKNKPSDTENSAEVDIRIPTQYLLPDNILNTSSGENSNQEKPKFISADEFKKMTFAERKRYMKETGYDPLYDDEERLARIRENSQIDPKFQKYLRSKKNRRRNTRLDEMGEDAYERLINAIDKQSGVMRNIKENTDISANVDITEAIENAGSANSSDIRRVTGVKGGSRLIKSGAFGRITSVFGNIFRRKKEAAESEDARALANVVDEDGNVIETSEFGESSTGKKSNIFTKAGKSVLGILGSAYEWIGSSGILAKLGIGTLIGGLFGKQIVGMFSFLKDKFDDYVVPTINEAIIPEIKEGVETIKENLTAALNWTTNDLPGMVISGFDKLGQWWETDGSQLVDSATAYFTENIDALMDAGMKITGSMATVVGAALGNLGKRFVNWMANKIGLDAPFPEIEDDEDKLRQAASPSTSEKFQSVAERAPRAVTNFATQNVTKSLVTSGAKLVGKSISLLASLGGTALKATGAIIDTTGSLVKWIPGIGTVTGLAMQGVGKTLKAGGSALKGDAKATRATIEQGNATLAKKNRTKILELLKKSIEKISGIAKKVTKYIPETKFTKAISTFGDKVIKAFKSASDDIVNRIGVIVSKKTANATADTIAAMIGVIQVGFTIYDVISGFCEAAYLFEVDEKYVTLGMRTVSSLMKAFLGFGVMSWIDLLLEVYSALTDNDAKKSFANALYGVIADDDAEAALDRAQAAMQIEVDKYNAANNTNLSVNSYNELKNAKWYTRLFNGRNNDYSSYTATDAEVNAYLGITSSASVNSVGRSSSGHSISSLPLVGTGIGTGRPVGYGNMMQNDARWANFPLGTFPDGTPSTMATGGCGPTVMSMLTSAFGTNNSPVAMAQYAKSNGYISSGGANVKLFTEGARKLGMTSTTETSSSVQTALQEGKPVVISGKSGSSDSPYTKAGHILLASGYNPYTRMAVINDPMSSDSKLVNIDTLKSGMTNAWSYAIGYGPTILSSDISGLNLGRNTTTTPTSNVGTRTLSSNLNTFANMSSLLPYKATTTPSVGNLLLNTRYDAIDETPDSVRKTDSTMFDALLRANPNNRELRDAINKYQKSYNVMSESGRKAALENIYTLASNKTQPRYSSGSASFSSPTYYSDSYYEPTMTTTTSLVPKFKSVSDGNGWLGKFGNLFSNFASVGTNLLNSLFGGEKYVSIMTPTEEVITSSYNGDTYSGSSGNYFTSTESRNEAKFVPPGHGKIHTYMGWQMITSKSSKQYKLKSEAENYDANGMGRVGDRYAVAVKPYYGGIGDYLNIVQEDGTAYKAIVADAKGNENAGQLYSDYIHGDGSLIEFVVDKRSWYSRAKGGNADNMHPNVGTSAFMPELGKNITSITNVGNYWQDSARNFGTFAGYNSVNNKGVKALLTVAANEIGTKEYGTNKVKYNDEYYGSSVAAPWCTTFVWWVFKHAGLSNIFFDGTKTASTEDLYNYFRTRNRFYTTGQPGDIAFFNYRGAGRNVSHVGIVESNNGGGSYTIIEGNVSNQVKRQVKSTNIVGFGRPIYPDSVNADTAKSYTNIFNPLSSMQDILGFGNGSVSDLVRSLNGHITSGYGHRSNSNGNIYHKGIDIGADLGQSIHSPVDGVVVDTGNDAAGYGNYTVIRDRNGKNHIFGHMNKPAGYGVGTRVYRNNIIGEVGSTGNSTGSHLHYEIRNNTSKYSTLDPSKYNINKVNTKSMDDSYEPTGNGNRDLSANAIKEKLNVALNAEGVENKLDTLIDVMRTWAERDIAREKANNVTNTTNNTSVFYGNGQTKTNTTTNTSSKKVKSVDSSLAMIHQAIAAR